MERAERCSYLVLPQNDIAPVDLSACPARITARHNQIRLPAAMLALCILALALDDGFVDTDDGWTSSHGCEQTKNHSSLADRQIIVLVTMVVPLEITNTNNPGSGRSGRRSGGYGGMVVWGPLGRAMDVPLNPKHLATGSCDWTTWRKMTLAGRNPVYCCNMWPAYSPVVRK